MAIVAAALVLAGCVSTGTKVTEDQAAQFEKGRSTEAEVLAKLGKPNGTALKEDGSRSDSYVYIQASANAIDYVPIVGLLAGGATGQSTTVTFTFDRSGILTGTTAVTTNNDVHTGLLNQ